MVRIKDLRSAKEAADDEKQKDIPLDDLANVDAYFGTGVVSSKPVTSVGATPPAPAPSTSPASSTEMEAFLADTPYMTGFKPSARDHELYEQMKKSQGRPSADMPSLRRWY